jgi:hypothetical protein
MYSVIIVAVLTKHGAFIEGRLWIILHNNNKLGIYLYFADFILYIPLDIKKLIYLVISTLFADNKYSEYVSYFHSGKLRMVPV